jgi:hypothetical protein
VCNVIIQNNLNCGFYSNVGYVAYVAFFRKFFEIWILDFQQNPESNLYNSL